MIPNTRSKSKNGASAYSNGIKRTDKDIINSDFWGDPNCDNHSLRIGFINIQTFPSLIGHYKNSSIRNLIHDYHLSILGLAEMNLYWPALTHEQQLSECSRSWFERVQSYTACNKMNTIMKGQRGGTAIIAQGKICTSSYGNSADSLGRWTVMTFRGR